MTQAAHTTHSAVRSLYVLFGLTIALFTSACATSSGLTTNGLTTFGDPSPPGIATTASTVVPVVMASVMLDPANAESYTRDGVRAHPRQAGPTTHGALMAAPDQSRGITAAALSAAPDQAGSIQAAVNRAALDVERMADAANAFNAAPRLP